MEQAAEWVTPVFAATVSAILTHAFSVIRVRAEWRREAVMLERALCRQEANVAAVGGDIAVVRHEYDARLAAFEETLKGCQKKCAFHVTEYEVEQRLQNVMIRLDELRRRVVALEDQVLGFNLDGSALGPIGSGRREG